MLNGGHDVPQKFLQIKHDDKFFSRLLSKESSKAEPSSRVLYYGGASGAVPFMWESQPGTPKHPLSDSSLPPLTPPPSYQSTPKTKPMQKNSKPSFLSTIFPRINSKKNHDSSAFSSSSISSSCSSGSYSFSSNSFIHRHFRVDDNGDGDGHGDGDEQATRSPTSILCFGVRHGFSKQCRGSRSKLKAK